MKRPGRIRWTMLKEDDKIPFTAHLEELRRRLIICFIAIGAGFAAAYGFKEKLFAILTDPLVKVMAPGDKLIYTGVTEAFFTYMKVSFLVGIMLAFPVIIYQFWMFVAPGLYTKEKRYLLPMVFLSSIFFIGGGLFGYYFVFPWGFKYLMGFATDIIRPLPSMREYLNFAAITLLAFGAVFELPLVVVLMARIGLVSVTFLRRHRKYAILIIFVIAAILTPGPDVISQLMMAIPLMILYEISIIGAVIFGKKASGETSGEPAP